MNLYYQEEGSGRPLVLLHGNGEDSSYFKEQITYFSAFARVIAVDTRGHGKSPRGSAPFTLKQFAEDLKVLLERLGIKKTSILGFSDGGNIALLFALKYPSRVSSLILNGANLNPFGVKVSVQLPVAAEYARLKLKACLSGFDKSKKLTPEEKKTKELYGLMVKEPWISEKHLKNIRIPTLVLAGTEDMIRDSHTRKIAELLPAGELKLLKGSHFIAAEEPAEFNRAVKEFLMSAGGWSNDEIRQKKGTEPSVITPEEMKKVWAGRKPKQIGWEKIHHSSVLVPLLEKEGELHVLFEVRASSLHRQPGEVCFPGGAVEAGEGKRQAAVRETMEELLLKPDQIEVLAPLDVLVTPGSVTIWPYLGLLKNYQGTYSADEVERIFTVPLRWFLEQRTERYWTRTITVPPEDFPFELVPGGRDYNWRSGRYDVLFYRNEHAVIWGMTAKIMDSFLRMYRQDMLASEEDR